jgi:hypothetical protein
MPPSKLIVISLMLGYLFFCTLSLTMPIWGAELFKNIKDPPPQREVPTGLPVTHPAPQPCVLCEGIRLQVTSHDLMTLASTPAAPPEGRSLSR